MDVIRYALDNQTIFMDDPDKLYELFRSFDDVDSFVKQCRKQLANYQEKRIWRSKNGR